MSCISCVPSLRTFSTIAIVELQAVASAFEKKVVPLGGGPLYPGGLSKFNSSANYPISEALQLFIESSFDLLLNLHFQFQLLPTFSIIAPNFDGNLLNCVVILLIVSTRSYWYCGNLFVVHPRIYGPSVTSVKVGRSIPGVDKGLSKELFMLASSYL